MGLIAKTLNMVLPAGLKQGADSDVLLVAPWAVGKPQFPPRNYRTYAVEGFAKNEMVYACIAALAQSADEVHIVAEQRVKGEWVRAEEMTTRGAASRAPKAVEAQRLMDQPTPHHDQFLWTQDLITYLHVSGNNFAQVELSPSQQPAALWNLQPDQVRIIPERRILIAGYEHDIAGQKVTLEPRQIIHHRLLVDPLNPLYGLAPLAVLARQVDGDNAATDYMKYFFDNMGMPAWLAVTKGKVSDDQKKQFKRGWKAEYGLEAARMGTGGVGGVAVVDGSQVDMTKVGAFPGNREMGFTEMRQVPEARICAVFRVHPQIAFSLLGFLHPTYAQARVADEIQWTQSYLPMYKRITGKLTIALRSFYGEDVRINIDTSGVTALQEDESERRKFWLEALTERGITVEEFREKVGMTADATGHFITPLNVLLEEAKGQKVVEVGGRKYMLLPVEAARNGGSKALTDEQQRFVNRIHRRRRKLAEELVPQLDRFFAEMAERVAGRVRTQDRGTAAFLNVYLETKQDYPFGPDDLVPSSEDANLRVILQPHILAAAEDAWEAAAGEFEIDAAFSVDDPNVARLLNEASSTRVRAITDATRTALQKALNTAAERGYSIFQLVNGVEEDGFLGIRALIEETYRNRAEAIARTEMGWASNQGATALYQSEGIEKVEVLDGEDWDDPCRQANGETWTVVEALVRPLEHPNCQRAFAPVVEEPVEAE